MDEFCVSAQPERFHPLLEEIFDGLHVVVGRGLDRLDALGVGQAEIAVEAAQGLPCGRIDPLELGERQLAQGDEIFDLHADAVADQCVLGKIIGELPRCIAVATVNGGYGFQKAGHTSERVDLRVKNSTFRRVFRYCFTERLNFFTFVAVQTDF